MGFTDWFKNNASEQPDSQLDLLGNSKPLPPKQRVDRVDVHTDFKAEIMNNGGSDRAITDSIIAETEELFDCNIEALYRETGGTKGKVTPSPAAPRRPICTMRSTAPSN